MTQLQSKYVLALLAAACILICASVLVGQKREPKLSDYPARVVTTTRSVRVNIHSTPDTVCFRTRLREVARSGVLFAGHYALGSWGCGTCQRIGIADLISGRAYVTPFETSSAQGVITVKPNSRLVVINDAERGNSTWYYLWNGRQLLDLNDGGRLTPHAREFQRCSEISRMR